MRWLYAATNEAFDCKRISWSPADRAVRAERAKEGGKKMKEKPGSSAQEQKHLAPVTGRRKHPYGVAKQINKLKEKKIRLKNAVPN